LAQAKKAARRVYCVNNLHQLGLAARMYWDEHDEEAFRFRSAATNDGDIYWFGWLERWTEANEGKRKFDARLGALYPYLQDRAVALCPSLNRHVQFKWKASGATYGYGYNWHLSTPLHQPPFKVSRLPWPAETVLMADAAQVNTFQNPATPEQPLLEEFYYVSADERTAHFRHGQKANALFCDLHVDQEKPVPGSFEPSLPRAWVGKLRPEILRVP
jgi:prepilin-type processing-associated H-X9-DG protein